MSELSPIKNLKNLKSDMANMTYGEKLKHIWTYYRWVLIVVLILIMAVSVLLTSIQNKRTITLLGGVTVNVQLSEEGRAALTDEYLQIIGTGNSREKIVVSHTDVADLSNTAVYESNYYAVMSLLALATNQELDYLLLDQTGFETLLVQGVYAGLDEIYTPEELEAMDDLLVYAKNADEDTPSAIALDITDCAFAQENIQTRDKVYFVYVTNSLRREACRAFYDYLTEFK